MAVERIYYDRIQLLESTIKHYKTYIEKLEKELVILRGKSIE